MIPGHVPATGYSLTVLITTQCSGILKKQCKRKPVNLLFRERQTTVRDALLALRAYIRPEAVDRTGKSTPRECFAGYSHLKKKETRTLDLGHPWKALQNSVPLVTLLEDSSSLLLAPRVSAHAIYPPE